MTSPSRIGYFIGMALADVRHFFRGRQAVPCLVDWEHEPDGNPDVSAVFVAPYGSLDPKAPTVNDLNSMQRTYGFTSAVGFNADPEDDCCPDYEVDCCLETDTIGEAQGKA